MLEYLYDEMMSFGLTRTDAVVALGGGVVGDLTGFAAATILRGVDYIQVPTTLLAQVDSSVGGKVAIDLKSGKNLAGAFWQPRMVLMDPDCLNTLDDKTFSDGMAEVIKYGCIWDKTFFEFLGKCGGRAGVMEHIELVLQTCCAIKADVVSQDEHDTGLRMILNFGHTLGHAYELAYHYETYTHGQAVAAGMCRAAEIGVTLGITPAEIPQQITQLVNLYGLPDAIDCSVADYEAAVGLDKKNAGNQITLILLSEMGKTQPTRLDRDRAMELIAPYGKES
jgi:3-dehydroquinate synthase